MTAGKTVTLTIGTFVSKVMSLLFNALSRSFNVMAAVTICSDFREIRYINMVIIGGYISKTSFRVMKKIFRDW